MEAVLELVQAQITEVEYQLDDLEPGHPERPELQMRLGTLQKKKAALISECQA